MLPLMKILLSLTVFAIFVNGDPFRLNSKIIPERYSLQLSFDDLTKNTFAGLVEIWTTVLDDVNSFKIHFDPKSSFGTILIESLEDGKLIIVSDVSRLEEFEMYEVKLEEELIKGKKYRMQFVYNGNLDHNGMYGVYVSSYRSYFGNGLQDYELKYVVATQFQATYARKAFPCFDEPEYKAKFNVTLKHPKKFKALSNTPITKVLVGGTPENEDENSDITQFKTTPEMSTYLLAFVIAPYESNGDSNLAIYTQHDLLDTAKYSLEVTPKLIKGYEALTEIKYHDYIEKLDQVALPEAVAEAMENWGLMTYRQSYLLWKRGESSPRNKQSVASMIAHELAHNWFGNIVTLKWWEDTWLNEGFAQYFEYFMTNEVEKDWEMDKQFLVDHHQIILQFDVLESVPPLSSRASSPLEIANKFSLISYSKGGSVIRMMRHFLGHEKFKEGLKEYLSDKILGNVVVDDLLGAFERHEDDFGTKMKSWIYKSGFPLVSVKLEEGKLKFSQKKFRAMKDSTESGEEATLWHIPLTYTTNLEGKFDETTAKVWLDGVQEKVVKVPDEVTWVLVNLQSCGYYRVNYEKSLWEELAKTLRTENFGGIPDLNRAQIVDDAFNLASAGEIPYSLAFEVTQFLDNETDYYVWNAAFRAYEKLFAKAGDSELAILLRDHLDRLTASLFTSLQFNYEETKQISAHKQALGMQWACEFEYKNCVSDALEKFDNYMKMKQEKRVGEKEENGDGENVEKKEEQNDVEEEYSIDPNLRSVIFCIALRYDNSTDNVAFNFLMREMQMSPLSATTIVGVLGCSRNRDWLLDLLKKNLETTSEIKAQDYPILITSIAAYTQDGVEHILDFLSENYERVKSRISSPMVIQYLVVFLADHIQTKEQLDKLSKFLEGKSHEIIVSQQAMEMASNNIKWAENYQEELEKYLKGKISGENFSIDLSTGILIMVFYLLFTN